MKRIAVVALLLAALAAGGCRSSDEDVAALKQRAGELEGRVAQLEQANASLQDDLRTLEWQYSAMRPKVDALAETRVGTREAVAEIVQEVLRAQPAVTVTPRIQQWGGFRGGAVGMPEGVIVIEETVPDVRPIVVPTVPDAPEVPPAPDRNK